MSKNRLTVNVGKLEKLILYLDLDTGSIFLDSMSGSVPISNRFVSGWRFIQPPNFIFKIGPQTGTTSWVILFTDKQKSTINNDLRLSLGLLSPRLKYDPRARTPVHEFVRLFVLGLWCKCVTVCLTVCNATLQVINSAHNFRFIIPLCIGRVAATHNTPRAWPIGY